MLRHYILENGRLKPATLMEWAFWFEEAGEDRIIEHTQLDGDVLVSTVFLGLDYNWTGRGKALLFETMVFGLKGEYEPQWRHATMGDAKRLHFRVVEAIKNGTPLEDVDAPNREAEEPVPRTLRALEGRMRFGSVRRRQEDSPLQGQAAVRRALYRRGPRRV